MWPGNNTERAVYTTRHRMLAVPNSIKLIFHGFRPVGCFSPFAGDRPSLLYLCVKQDNKSYSCVGGGRLPGKRQWHVGARHDNALEMSRQIIFRIFIRSRSFRPIKVWHQIVKSHHRPTSATTVERTIHGVPLNFGPLTDYRSIMVVSRCTHFAYVECYCFSVLRMYILYL